jgi:lipopolysaccharide transport system ATP-binding protein
MNYAVKVNNLSKQYTLQGKNQPKTIMDLVLSGFHGFSAREKFWALQDINLEVKFGEMLGIMGQNGSGKSSLLQLIGGVGKPDRGKIQVNGQLRGLLDLGAGFHQDLTGRENTFVGGIVAGLSKKEVQSRFAEIVDFAELQEFIDHPVRTYSSGMRMRLAFSVAIHTNPEVLLIDEHISVGDIKFKEKCQDKISELKNNGCAIIYVSQSPQQIGQICDRALWLNKGVTMSYGDAQEVSMDYLASIHNQRQQSNDNLSDEQKIIVIKDVQLIPDAEIEINSPITVEITYIIQKTIANFIIGVNIVNDEGQICFANYRQRNSWGKKIMKRTIETVRVEIERLDLCRGKYFVNISITELNTHYVYDLRQNLYSLTINSHLSDKGIISPPCHWQLKSENSLIN